jgi:hypothetical protein
MGRDLADILAEPAWVESVTSKRPLTFSVYDFRAAIVP